MKPYAVTFTNNHGSFTFIFAAQSQEHAIELGIGSGVAGAYGSIAATPVYNEFEEKAGLFNIYLPKPK